MPTRTWIARVSDLCPSLAGARSIDDVLQRIDRWW
jgi:hypothetical protein